MRRRDAAALRALRRRAFFSAVPVLGLLCLLGLVELGLRVAPVDADLARFSFFVELKVSRWAYLRDQWVDHQMDAVLARRKPGDWLELPEARRPPFDQVPLPYPVDNNAQGYRDDAWVHTGGAQRVLLLGDSVSFGKGVEVQDRYADLIERERPGVDVRVAALQGCRADCMSHIFQEQALSFRPDLLVVQASANDLDQALFRLADTGALPGLQLGGLSLANRSRLLVRLLHARESEDNEQQLRIAAEAAAAHTAEANARLFGMAAKMGVPVVVLQLSYAYGWRYGDHVADACAHHGAVCRGVVEVDFAAPPAAAAALEPRDLPLEADFVARTAAQMAMPEDELAQVFPHRDQFLDVVHLSPRGHATVASQLLPAVDAALAAGRPRPVGFTGLR